MSPHLKQLSGGRGWKASPPPPLLFHLASAMTLSCIPTFVRTTPCLMDVLSPKKGCLFICIFKHFYYTYLFVYRMCLSNAQRTTCWHQFSPAPCESLGLNLDHQTWMQAPLQDELPHPAALVFCFISTLSFSRTWSACLIILWPWPYGGSLNTHVISVKWVRTEPHILCSRSTVSGKWLGGGCLLLTVASGFS